MGDDVVKGAFVVFCVEVVRGAEHGSKNMSSIAMSPSWLSPRTPTKKTYILKETAFRKGDRKLKKLC